MDRWKMFALGAFGGLLPSLVTLAALDPNTYFDHWAFTAGNMVGYAIKGLVLVVIGGAIAALSSGVTQPITLVQLGLAAPALITSWINGAPPAPAPKSAFGFVSSAYAAGAPPHVKLAGGFLNDLYEGALRPPAAIRTDNINRDLGTALNKSIMNSRTDSPNQLTITVFPDTPRANTNPRSGTYCQTAGGAFGPGPAVAAGQSCVVTTGGGAATLGKVFVSGGG